MGGLAWQSRATLNAAHLETVFQQNLGDEIDELRWLVIDAETGQRGFVITGDEAYLEPYNDAIARKQKHVQALNDFVAPTSKVGQLLPSLLALIEARDAELLEAVAIRRSSDFESAQAAVQSNVSKHLTDRIREQIEEIRELIDADKHAAQQAFQSQLNRTTILLNLGAGAALLSGLVGLALLGGHAKAHAEAIDMEREKDRAEKADREKSRFLASMSHEIRTPLNAMLGFTELLESEISSPKGAKYLAAVQDSGHALVELINDVLDLSKIESGILELDEEATRISDLADSIRMLFSQQAETRGLDYHVEITESCPTYLVIDGLRLRQILINLVGNALKFTQAGSVRVRFSAEKASKISCTLVLQVSDTGRGVSPGMQKAVFKPFQQNRPEDELLGGTGLGLSISRELASLMGGRIALESREGEGSVFTLSIPAVAIASEAASIDEKSTGTSDFDLLEASSILVVDDNPFNRELVAAYLDGSHHKVSFATNGKEGLEQAQRLRPDVVLMDIRMPVMSGREAREKLKEVAELSAIPVIAVTASSLLRQENVLRKEFDGYLRKPFSRAELFGALEKSVARVSPGTPAVAAGDQARSSDSGSDSHNSAQADQPATAAPAETTDADPAAGAAMPELRAALLALYEQRWRTVSEAMVLSEVIELAGELRGIGTRHDHRPTIEYADRIRNQAQNFEMAALDRSLGAFEATIAAIPAE